MSVSEIREVSEIVAATQVPGSPEEIAGIVEVRGRIVTLMDLAKIHGVPATPGAGCLAVQLAPPLGHLGILVPGRVENLETGPASMDPLLPSRTDEPQDSVPDPEDNRGTPLGREIVVGGRPTYVLDVQAHYRLCTQRVRERFRVAE